ncbi:hypothetical protein G6716_01340 [Polynucleobacter paneuropaeus]|nr:hypothetical protein G6716_01340 [Polynucleobacter paneuropaeus]
MKLTEKSLAAINTASVCALLFIWVLPDTIALRHLLLGIGCLSGLVLIRDNRTFFIPFRTALIPLILLCSLFIWVGIHYLFFSLNPALELSEIRGLWSRAFAGVIMALGLGISLFKYPALRKYFYISTFSVPLINISAYGYDSYLNHQLVMPNDFIFFLFAKIETAYFGAIAAAVTITNLIKILVLKNKKSRPFIIVLYCLGLILLLVSALISSSKNGIAILIALYFIFVFILFLGGLLNQGQSRLLSFIIIFCVLSFTVIAWKEHKNFAYKGWDSLLQDAEIAVNIDKYQQWQDGSFDTLPMNSLGQHVAINTYQRVAYAMVGIRLISQYPMGYGSINQSFFGLQNHAGIPHSHHGQVHSGWVDFGLALGLPGLFILFAYLVAVSTLALRKVNEMTLLAAFIGLTLFLLGLIAEINYKQYFEATIFFFTFAACLIAVDRKKN